MTVVGSPEPVGGTVEPRRLALSPSRASDFKTCPLRYRYRAIDRLPEAPSRPAARGTLVHAVLQDLFTRPAPERTVQNCVDSIGEVWRRLSDDPSIAALIPDDGVEAWIAGAATLVRTYFKMENPAGFEPRACEHPVTAEAAGGVPLKGFIDRVDVSAAGEIRIVDYKTGRPPGETSEAGSLFQLKFYALALYRRDGQVPTELKLLYLDNGVSLRYRPDLAELLAFERGLVALWETISAAVESGDFPANRSGACRYCRHQSICPEFGGVTLPYVPPETPPVPPAARDEHH